MKEVRVNLLQPGDLFFANDDDVADFDLMFIVLCNDVQGCVLQYAFVLNVWNSKIWVYKRVNHTACVYMMEEAT